MKKMRLRQWGYLLLLGALLVSCSGEDGRDGIDGEDGQDGVDGQDGQDGIPGSTDVIYSDWIPSGFKEKEPIGLPTSSIQIGPITDITDEITNNGVVLVYGRIIGGSAFSTRIFPLPNLFDQKLYVFRIVSPFVGDDVGATIEIVASSTNNDDVGITVFDEFRYVIIQSTSSAGPLSKSENAESLDYSRMTYEEIKKIFNIQD